MHGVPVPVAVGELQRRDMQGLDGGELKLVFTSLEKYALLAIDPSDNAEMKTLAALFLCVPTSLEDKSSWAKK